MLKIKATVSISSSQDRKRKFTYLVSKQGQDALGGRASRENLSIKMTRKPVA